MAGIGKSQPNKGITKASSRVRVNAAPGANKSQVSRRGGKK